MNSCRCMKSGSGMAIGIKKGRSGVSVPLVRRRYAGMGIPNLLEGNVRKDVYEPTIIEDPQSYNIKGGAMKSDMTKITEKLDKLNLMKPKNIRKNIRVSL